MRLLPSGEGVKRFVLLLILCHLKIVRCTRPCTNQVRLEKFSGIIDHPGAGKNYSADSDVCWLIEIEGSVAIRFTKFDLENNYDWIKIYEDTTVPESESKVRFHLNKVEQVANSEFWLTGRVVLIRFKSDTSVQKTGFRLKYRKIPFYTLPVAGGPSAVEIISGASAGVVHSHAGFEKGKNYSHNVQQAWSIRAQPSQLIRVTFTTFNTEKNFDFLRIFSGALPNVQSSEMYANLSGNIAKPTDYNFFGSLTFVFSSDRSNDGKGFRFMYQILQTDNSLQPVFHNWTGSFSKELGRTADFSLIAKPADSALKARCSVRKECANLSETFVTPSEYRYLANETRLKFQLRPRKSDPDSLYCVGAVLCHVSWKSEAYRNIEYSLDLPKPDPTSLSIHLVRPDLWTQTGLIEFFAVSESVCPKVRHRCELRTEDGRIVEARILQVTASPTKPASCHISSLKTLFATPIPGNGSFDATTIACRLNDGNFIKYRVTSKTFTAHQESQKSMNAWERPLHIIAWVAAAVAVTLLVAVMIRNARNRKKRHGLTAVNRAALKMSKQEVGHGHSSSASFRNNSYLTNHPANENQVSEVYVTLPN